MYTRGLSSSHSQLTSRAKLYLSNGELWVLSLNIIERDMEWKDVVSSKNSLLHSQVREQAYGADEKFYLPGWASAQTPTESAVSGVRISTST